MNPLDPQDTLGKDSENEELIRPRDVLMGIGIIALVCIFAATMLWLDHRA